MLQDLPPQLHAEVKGLANHDTVQLIREIELFGDLDDVILNKLIVSLRTQFLPPNESVCLEGDLGRHCYIIRKGICQVRAPGLDALVSGHFVAYVACAQS